MHPRLAALVIAALACGAPVRAAGADAPAASPFPVVPTRAEDARPHRLAWATAAAGVALVAVSFPLAAEADDRYAAYLAETDPARIEERYQATRSMDRWARGSLIAGQVLLATAVYLRFVHDGGPDRTDTRPGAGALRLHVAADRCALALRF